MLIMSEKYMHLSFIGYILFSRIYFFLFLGVTGENFSKEKISLEVSNDGMQAEKTFNRIYCDHCERSLFPNVLNNEVYRSHDSLVKLL